MFILVFINLYWAKIRLYNIIYCVFGIPFHLIEIPPADEILLLAKNKEPFFYMEIFNFFAIRSYSIIIIFIKMVWENC